MIVGIDLGMTTSSVAFIDGDTPRVIPNRYGAAVTPSVVGYHDDKGVLVGEEALNLRVTNHGRTVTGFKRRMGSTFPVSLGPAIYSPRDISALLLKRLLRDAARYLGQPVTDAVIAVPANFSEPQRQDTVDAGKIAGLRNVRLINEPTAAALAYGSDISGRTAVFDFGGGTLDVSLLEIHNGEVRVRCVGGEGSLGGIDFTRALYAHIRERSSTLADSGDAMLQAQLLDLAERAKIELSSMQLCSVAVPGSPLDVSRNDFENAVSPLFKRAGQVLIATLNQAGWSAGSVETVIFAGGTSRIPSVRHAIESVLRQSSSRRTSPQEVVALGAARSTLSASRGGTRLFEIIPYDLGIEIDGGRMLRLIERHSALPAKICREFTTLADNQSSVEIHVLQGGYLAADRNRSLGRFMLNGIPAARKGEPKIEVEFGVDLDGLLSVRARDSKSGISERIVIPRLTEPRESSVQGSRRLNRLLEEVKKESRKYRFLIDQDLKDDIDDIIRIAAASVTGEEPGRQQECVIALQTILDEIRALNTADREADCAG